MIKSAIAKSGLSKLPVEITNHQGWAVVTITSKKTRDVQWEVTFEPTEFYPFPARTPERLRIRQTGPDSVQASWREQYYLNNGYRVYLDGKLLGYTPVAMFPMTGLETGREYTLEVETTWEDGTVSGQKAETTFTLQAENE